MKRFGIPSTSRLTKSSEFKEVQNRGKKLSSKHLLLFLQKKDAPPSQIGITVSTKVSSKAVDRNRVKRRLRELFRTSAPQFTCSVELVVIARQGAHECSFADLRKQFLGTLHSHGYLKPKTNAPS